MRSVMVRRVVVCALVLAGCSSGGHEPVTTGPASTPPTTTSDDRSDVDESDAVASSPSGQEPLESVYAVAVDVVVDRLDLTEQLEVAIDQAELDEIDPFTHFSSCSGLRASIDTFTVTVVDDTAAVRSVSVVTTGSVTGPGTHDADVRIRTATNDTVSALGTMTLDQSWRSGSFLAFEATGESVSGTFDCDGPPGTPNPLADVGTDGEAGDGDGELRVVEVVTLLRRGDEERIVGLTLDTAELATAEADCPGVSGSGGAMLVSVDGGPAVGAITTFVLVPDQSPSMHMRVGGVTYEVDDITVDADDRATAGTFSGLTVDGIAVDGAFRCA